MANPKDKRFFQLTLAIQKAINTNETPVKEKHVRSTIIGTFQEQGACTYWMVAIRLPLQENRIVAWKFCHVTHKLLREGHPACLDDSQRHIGMIENLGKLWVHLREGYGKLVHLYCDLLVCKLKFHARNPRFPGNMQLTADELDAIAENDVNNYFQLCVELFDYMDDILTLQAAVFDSLGNARANSMTASGQCRLAALIPCAQDASHIYDCNVRLLFRLHASLPADTLTGHRERFRQQFKKLGSFYKHASSLQYYRNLLTLPVLPSNPPNFLQQSDFGTYVTPVVSIPEPPPDEVDAVGSLIDTSDTFSLATSDPMEELDTRPTPSPQPDPIIERDRLIDHLQNELKRMRTEVSQLVQERNTMLGSMRDHCTRLETQLNVTKTELEQERERADILSVQTPEMKQKLTETEEKAKVVDEKFQKLKGAYTQLREEHITLIRQKAEVDKLAASIRAAAAQHESAKVALQQQLNDRMKDVELLQQSSSSSEEVEAYKTEILSLRTDLEQSRQKELELETVKATVEALEIEHKTATKEQEEKLIIVTNELKEAKDVLEKVKHERDEKDLELGKIKEELIGLREKSGDEYKKVVEEKEGALKTIAELKEQHMQEKEELTQSTRENIDKLLNELSNLQRRMNDTEINCVKKCDKLNEDFTIKIREFEQVLNNKDIEIQETLDKLTSLHTELENTKISYDERDIQKTKELESLQATVEDYRNRTTVLTAEREDIQMKLEEKLLQLTDIENAIVKLENDKNQEISELKEELDTQIADKNKECLELRKVLAEKSELSNRQMSDSGVLMSKITEFESVISDKKKEIDSLNLKLNETLFTVDQQKNSYEEQLKDNKYEISILMDKLKNVIVCKDEIINNLKSMIAEKDEQVIALNVEVTKISEDVIRLREELVETQAELEIGNNELVSLREEHESIIGRNESNLVLKNKELRSLHDEINNLNQQRNELETEKEKIISDFVAEKQVYEGNIKKLNNVHEKLRMDYEFVKKEQETLTSKFTDDINKLVSEFDGVKAEKDDEISQLTNKITALEINLNEEIIKKDAKILEDEENIVALNIQLDDLQKSILMKQESMEATLSEREKEKQYLETRLEHAEEKRLNAECELQDLLQHNSELEDNLATLKKQLEETQRELEKQTSRLVSCAGEAALEVTNGALAALERSNAQDTNKEAAEMAARALDELIKNREVKGNEETVARSAIYVAHNTAQLSAYVIEVSHISTDMDLADKLHNECRTMLTSTKQCLETLRDGSIPTTECSETRRQLQRLASAAAAADTVNTTGRSVDDELADMDMAIEQAASQIEELLAASRAGDSGVKLEVNSKILDACTTLMGAVKILVQDARKLQNELGDPKTRQKMYRKNPQWSEGLISAAKAVVFAAKLLVSSADEAVGAAGRVEGVSAAAHEVAGSTAQLVAASRARAPPATPALARLTQASRAVAAATGAVVAAVRAGSALVHDQEALDTSTLTITATRRLEMESKVRSLELESALEAERVRLAALRKRHYQLAQQEENGSITNGKE